MRKSLVLIDVKWDAHLVLLGQYFGMIWVEINYVCLSWVS